MITTKIGTHFETVKIELQCIWLVLTILNMMVLIAFERFSNVDFDKIGLNSGVWILLRKNYKYKLFKAYITALHITVYCGGFFISSLFQICKYSTTYFFMKPDKIDMSYLVCFA